MTQLLAELCGYTPPPSPVEDSPAPMSVIATHGDESHGVMSCVVLDDTSDKLAVRCSVHGAIAVVFGLARARRVRCSWCAAEGRG